MSITAGQLPGWIAESQDAFDLTFVDTPAHDTDTLADAASSPTSRSSSPNRPT
jgi:chromosome partitioning protein